MPFDGIADPVAAKSLQALELWAVRLIRTAYCHKGFLLVKLIHWEAIDRISNRRHQAVRNISQKSGLSAQDFCHPYPIEKMRIEFLRIRQKMA
jgi:hypothetical protein